MPAAVWRIRPARSISLWLTIWASAGVSLATGRKYRVRRMAWLYGPGCGNATIARRGPACCRPATATAQNGHAANRAVTRAAPAHIQVSRNQGLNGLVRGGFGPASLLRGEKSAWAGASEGGRRPQGCLTG